jgi:hypothetical protein
MKNGVAAKKRFTLRINVNQDSHLIRIGKLQTSADIVPVAGHIKMDGTCLDIRMGPSKPVMSLYRFLSGILIGHRIFRNIRQNRIMMIGIRYQIVI